MNEIKFIKIDSTNEYIKRQYKLLDNYTFVSAKSQSNGHGRFNRKWQSKPNKNLLFSLLIKDIKNVKSITDYPLIAGISVYQALVSLNIKDVKIKWPNDIYVSGKKIAGILVESSVSENNINYIIIGIGLNINERKFRGLNATSIRNELDKKVSIKKIKEILYNKLLYNIENPNYNEFLNIFRNNNYLINKTCYATIRNAKTKIKVLDILDDFKLKVENEFGEIESIISDEITFS